MRTTSRMRWNVSPAAVGRIFLVAIALGEADGLPGPPMGHLPRRYGRAGDAARSAFAFPCRTHVSRGRPLA